LVVTRNLHIYILYLYRYIGVDTMQEGYLKLSVLKILSEQDCSGYDLMKKIEESLGKKPSSGSMYPLLKGLEHKKLISSKIQQRSTLYHLTAQGKQELNDLLSHRQELFTKMERTHHYMEQLCGEKPTHMQRIFQRVVQGKAPFGSFTFDAIRFRDTLFKASNCDLTDRQKQQIKTLLQQTTKEIEYLCKKS